MIIFGYQGIGKSTLANSLEGAQFIDLESSMFRTPMHPERSEDWFQAYGNIAYHLSHESNKVVLCSCHDKIRDYIYEEKETKNEHIAICYPSLDLKDAWLERLTKRYELTHELKDKAALDFAVASYTSSIKALEKDTNFDHIVICDINYSLLEAIKSYHARYKHLDCDHFHSTGLDTCKIILRSEKYNDSN